MVNKTKICGEEIGSGAPRAIVNIKVIKRRNAANIIDISGNGCLLLIQNNTSPTTAKPNASNVCT
jgi:hypothetical protein